MALSSRWVDAVFARMLVRYGSAWLRMWDGVDIDAVKADWAQELAGLEGKPSSIKHALENLPADRPPSVTQFKALCANSPDIFKALPEPKADPQRVNEALGRMRQMKVGVRPNQWAYDLQARELAGEILNSTQRAAWRESLGRTAQPEPGSEA